CATGTMASGALPPPALGAAALAGASVALDRAAGAAAAGAASGAPAAAVALPIWSERMVTGWIFFGSPDPARGAAGGCDGAPTLGGADGSAGAAGNEGAAPAGKPAGAAFGESGIVETIRGGAFGGWVPTRWSPRGTRFFRGA